MGRESTVHEYAHAAASARGAGHQLARRGRGGPPRTHAAVAHGDRPDHRIGSVPGRLRRRPNAAQGVRTLDRPDPRRVPPSLATLNLGAAAPGRVGRLQNGAGSISPLVMRDRELGASPVEPVSQYTGSNGTMIACGRVCRPELRPFFGQVLQPLMHIQHGPDITGECGRIGRPG